MTIQMSHGNSVERFRETAMLNFGRGGGGDGDDWREEAKRRRILTVGDGKLTERRNSQREKQKSSEQRLMGSRGIRRKGKFRRVSGSRGTAEGILPGCRIEILAGVA